MEAQLREYEVHSHEFPSVTADFLNIGGVAVCTVNIDYFHQDRDLRRVQSLFSAACPSEISIPSAAS